MKGAFQSTEAGYGQSLSDREPYTSRRLGRAVLKLARETAWGHDSLNSALRSVTERAAQILDHERVSIWEYREDSAKLVCLDLFERTSGSHTNGQELTTREYPSYFESLGRERVIDAHDANTDPRTREFSESYLKPLGISSMLDSPYLVGGEVGGVVCFEHVGAPRTYDSGHVEFAAAVADVLTLAFEAHERRKAQRALEENERNLQRIFDALPQWVTVLTDGEVVIENKALELSKKGPSSQKPRQRGEDNGFVEETRIETAGKHRILQTKRLPIEFRGHPSLLVVANDVTELKRAEALQIGWNKILHELATGQPVEQTLNHLARLAEESTPGARATVLLLPRDSKHLRVFAAPSFPDSYRIAVENLEIGPENASCGTAAHLSREVIVDDTSIHPYWKNYRDLAQEFEIGSCWSRPILSKANEVLGTFSLSFREPCAPTPDDREFMHHCTHVAEISVENWLTERRSQEIHDRLEKLVLERTTDLSQLNEELRTEVRVRKKAEALLRRAAKDLRRSNADLEEFAYVASHDLQAPLRKIEMFVQMLANATGKTHTPEQVEMLERIQSTSNRMRSLVSDLLTFSTAGNGATPTERVELNEVLEEVLSNLSKQIEDAEAEIVVSELSSVRAHRTELRQLLQNLLSNSLKYRSPGKKPVIRIESRRVPPDLASSDPKEFVEIRVTDNGIGFEIDKLDRILMPFQRLHGSSRYEGTGIGLAICRKIAERAGGAILAESTPGEGSTFIAQLPDVESR